MREITQRAVDARRESGLKGSERILIVARESKKTRKQENKKVLVRMKVLTESESSYRE